MVVLKRLALLVVVAVARKPPKKFENAKEMALNAPALEAKGDQLFCVAPPDTPAATLIFGSITWDIEFKPNSRGRARAVSDDDFHEAGRTLFGKLVGADGNVGKQLDAKLAKRPLFPMPWDSCPNPFSDCVLDLSPYGNSCATVSSRKPYKVRVNIDRGFPIRPIMVLAGIALLAAAHALSANVPFQYGSAVVMGECVALCLIVLYFIRRAGGGFKSKMAAAGLYGLLVQQRKGGTIVRKTLLDHWELAFIYFIIVAMASCWVVGVSRKTKNFHETVRVATKWTLRGVAESLLHNAFKAPAAQFVMYLVLAGLYARTRVLKLTHKKQYYREEKTN